MTADLTLSPLVTDLAAFADAAVLGASEVHAAARLARLAGGPVPGQVLLALALAVRAPSAGHVCVDLTTDPARLVGGEVDAEIVRGLPWPRDPDSWLHALRACPVLVAEPDAARHPPRRPLVLDGTRVYLQRLWSDEQRVAESLLARADRLTVIVGGPGTGKTTLVARMLLDELARPDAPVVALAAPTGKAAARLKEVVLDRANHSGADARGLERLREVGAGTIHRLLGSLGPRGFRHDAHNPLPHDLVVIDEMSMVDLPLMADLLAAVRPSARLVLVGDPDQLASVEAGTVLADIVGPSRAGPGAAGPLSASVTVLRETYRFSAGSGIAHLAGAIGRGDADAAVDLLAAGGDELRWIAGSGDVEGPAAAPVLAEVVAGAQQLVRLARQGDADDALGALGHTKVLCALRRGPAGVAGWNEAVRRALGPAAGELWALGRPVLVTRNDPLTGLFNGDQGVVVAGAEGRRQVAVPAVGGHRLVSPGRIEHVDTAYALTIHKSQGSEYDEVVVVLPDAASPILSRELLFTAVTRARRRVCVIGSADAVRAAVRQPIARSSGLAERLWGGS